MAKKTSRKRDVNKSEEVRALIKSGMTSPSEIVAKLKTEKGITVSPQMVSTLKSKMTAKRTARKIGRRRTTANSSAVTDIKALARFVWAVERVGGVDEARRILGELEE